MRLICACRLNHRLCVVIGIPLHKTAKSRKMCIKCQLHILRVLNVCLAGLGLSPFVQHLVWHLFFPSSLLGFQAFKYLSDVQAKFLTICGGKMCSIHGTGGNFTKHGNFQSPHIKLLAQMQPGSMFHLSCF